MLRIILLPSESERLAVLRVHGTQFCPESRQTTRSHRFLLHRMELSAAKAPSPADLPESVSRP